MTEPKKSKKSKQKKTKATQHQSNKQRVVVNVHVGSKGGRRSKGGARPQPQQQQQMRPAPAVVNVQAPQPLPPMPHAPYVAIPSGPYRPPPIQMDPGGTIAGNTQHAVDRSLSATHTVSSLPSLMGSYAPAGNSIKMPEYEDDNVSEMSFDTPYSQHSAPPMDMGEFLALALPYKSQPASAMKAYAQEPSPMMIPVSKEEESFMRGYNNSNRSVSTAAPSIASAKVDRVENARKVLMGPSLATLANRLDTGSVHSTPSHIAFREKMTTEDGVNPERLKRMSKPDLTGVYMKYYNDQPPKRATKAELLDAILKRFKK